MTVANGGVQCGLASRFSEVWRGYPHNLTENYGNWLKNTKQMQKITDNYGKMRTFAENHRKILKHVDNSGNMLKIQEISGTILKIYETL